MYGFGLSDMVLVCPTFLISVFTFLLFQLVSFCPTMKISVIPFLMIFSSEFGGHFIYSATISEDVLVYYV
jgi:hypothetical protein